MFSRLEFTDQLAVIDCPDSACKCCIRGVAPCAVSGNSGLLGSNFEKALATISRTQKILDYITLLVYTGRKSKSRRRGVRLDLQGVSRENFHYIIQLYNK